MAGKFSKFSSKPCSINKVQQEYHLVNVYITMENNHLYFTRGSSLEFHVGSRGKNMEVEAEECRQIEAKHVDNVRMNFEA